MQDGNYMLVQTGKFFQLDNHGNVLYKRLFESPCKTQRFVILNLKLKSENRIRSLGYVDLIEGIFYCLRKSAKHFHRLSKSYGFNYTILNEKQLNIRRICLDVDHEETYIFPMSLITQYGKCLSFSKQGFELQRFVKFDLIKKYNTNDKITFRLDTEEQVDG